MEAMRHSPLPSSAEASTSLAKQPPAEAAASTNKETSVNAALASEPTSPAAAQKNWSVDVTLSSEKKALSAEDVQSMEKMVSIQEPATPIGDPLFYRRNVVFLGRNLVVVVPDLKGAVLLVVLASVLYALLTPWLLWRVAGQPMTFVWTTSLVSISYSLVGTICLSETMGPCGLLLRFSGGTLLAVAASHVISPVTGAATASLVTFYATGMLGYSIGEYLQRIGFEKSAEVVAGRPARDEEQEKIREEWLVSLCFFQGIISLFILVRMVWVLFVPGLTAFDDPIDVPLGVVGELSAETLVLAWIWSGAVALPMLEETLVSFDTVFGKGLVCFIATCALSIMFMADKCYVASLLVMWTVAMAAVGFFGYCFAVYARCKHIQSRYVLH